MTQGKGVYGNWSGMRSVLSGALGKPGSECYDEKGWLTFQWNIIVGREIAAVSEIDRLAGKTLHVRVAGGEWLPALESLSNKIIREINQRAEEKLLSRIVFKEGN
ncbi:MAG: DciA family protein [Nitrospinaceae bacterium]